MSTRRDVRSERRGGEARDPKRRGAREHALGGDARETDDAREKTEARGMREAPGGVPSEARAPAGKYSSRGRAARTSDEKSSHRPHDDEMGTYNRSNQHLLSWHSARRSALEGTADSLWDRKRRRGRNKARVSYRTRIIGRRDATASTSASRRALARAPSAANARARHPRRRRAAGFRAQSTQS